MDRLAGSLEAVFVLFIFLVRFDDFWCVCVILFLVGILGGVSVCSPHLFSSYARWSLGSYWCIMGAFVSLFYRPTFL